MIKIFVISSVQTVRSDAWCIDVVSLNKACR
jgi:hypothetical protein